jgi:hypothetical protein
MAKHEGSRGISRWLGLAFVAGLSVVAFGALAGSPSKYDVGYFTDADELEPPHTGLYGSVPESVQARLPESKRAFCRRNEFDIAQLAVDGDHSISFPNPGGVFGGGVCWWHSRLQRSALYLANFRPELPKPSVEEAKRLISQLTSMNRVVEIPGYSNLLMFSMDFSKEMTAELSKWQITDGLKVEPIVNGLSGDTEEPTQRLQNRIENINDRLLRKKAVLWAKLQMPGIAAHAWLITNIEPIREPSLTNPFKIAGYRLTVLDSNEPTMAFTRDFRYGDTKMTTVYFNDGFVPYVDYDSDLAKIEDSLRAYCR